MTPALFALAAAIGAVGRHVLARVVCSWQALLVANSVGAALLGWLLSRDIDAQTMTVVGVGFCGALTTFSSFAVEVRALGPRTGTLYAAVTLICVTGAASLASAWSP